MEGPEGQGDVFKSPESGSQGMFLGGDPSYEQKDQQLIQALGLNFKHVVVGRRAGPGRTLDAAVKQKKPVIFYWYTPQYLNAQFDLVG